MLIKIKTRDLLLQIIPDVFPEFLLDYKWMVFEATEHESLSFAYHITI